MSQLYLFTENLEDYNDCFKFEEKDDDIEEDINNKTVDEYVTPNYIISGIKIV